MPGWSTNDHYQARTQDFQMGGGHDPQGVPPMLVAPSQKKRLRSSIHPERSQSQDGPSQT